MTDFRFTSARLLGVVCPAGKDRVYVRDTGSLGLALCVTETGSRTFYLVRRVNGRPTRVRLGIFPGELSIEDARAAAHRANALIADGIDPRAAKMMEAARKKVDEN